MDLFTYPSIPIRWLLPLLSLLLTPLLSISFLCCINDVNFFTFPNINRIHATMATRCEKSRMPDVKPELKPGILIGLPKYILAPYTTNAATTSESKNARTTAFMICAIDVDLFFVVVVAIFCASFFPPSSVVMDVVAKAFTCSPLRRCRDALTSSKCAPTVAMDKAKAFLSPLSFVCSICSYSMHLFLEGRRRRGKEMSAVFLLFFWVPTSSDAVQAALDAEAIQTTRI